MWCLKWNENRCWAKFVQHFASCYRSCYSWHETLPFFTFIRQCQVDGKIVVATCIYFNRAIASEKWNIGASVRALSNAIICLFPSVLPLSVHFSHPFPSECACMPIRIIGSKNMWILCDVQAVCTSIVQTLFTYFWNINWSRCNSVMRILVKFK